MLVKGAIDYIINNAGVVATITEPDVPELEAIGGTGETITGLVAAFTKENVSRLAQSKGYSVIVEETSDGYRLLLCPPGK